MKRTIILTENEKVIFRMDSVIKNGKDDIENDIAKFIVELDKKKNMVNCKKVIKHIENKNLMTLDSILDYFAQPGNISLFAKSLNEEINNVKINFETEKIRIKQNLIEALKV